MKTYSILRSDQSTQKLVQTEKGLILSQGAITRQFWTAKARPYSVDGFSVNLEMHVITYLILGLIAGHLTLDNSLESCNQ